MGSDKNILLVYPSRGRPRRLLAALNDFVVNWSQTTKLSIIVSLDTDDPMLSEYIGIIDAYVKAITSPNFHLEAIINSNKTVVVAINRAYTEDVLSHYNIISLISDDFRMPENWDRLFIEEFEKYGYNKIVKSFQPGAPNPKLITIQMAGTQFWKDYGTFVWPEYMSVYGDTDITGWAQVNERIVEAPHIICRHLNPGCGQPDGFPMDDIYQRENSPLAYSIGEQVYNRRMANGFRS